MRRAFAWIAVLSAAVLLSCEEEGPRLDPRLKPFDEARKSAPATPPDAGTAAAPAQPVDDGKERVTLRWKIARGQPLAIQAQLGAAKGAAPDPAKLARGEALTSEALADAVGSGSGTTAVTAVLEALDSGEIAVRARAESTSKSPPKAPLATAVNALDAEGKIRANMSARGFISSDLNRHVRNMLALMFELPSDPVAVGDTWRSSADLVSPGDAFVSDERARTNTAKLTALETDAKGRKVAVIEYALAEHQSGTVIAGKDKSPGTLSSAFVARGRFLVDEGRWASFEGRAVTHGTGALEVKSDERFELTEAKSVPKELLEDPAPKAASSAAEDDGHGHGAHEHEAETQFGVAGGLGTPEDADPEPAKASKGSKKKKRGGR